MGKRKQKIFNRPTVLIISSHVHHLIQLMIPHFDLPSETKFNQLHNSGLHTQKDEPTEKAAQSNKPNFDFFHHWWQ